MQRLLPEPLSLALRCLGLTPLTRSAALVEKTLAEVRKQAAELATDSWMYEHPRSNLAVLSQITQPKQ